MKNLLCILSYAKANDLVARHWPWYEKAGCDILFVGREDTECRVPTGPAVRSLVGQVNIGKDSYVKGDNLPFMFINTLRHCLNNAAFDIYTHFALTEPDTIFLRFLPLHPGGFTGCLAGGASEGFHAPYYFHPVWRMDRPTAKLMVDYGQRMLQAGLIEQGFPDRWLGLMVHLYDIPYEHFPEYSRQAIDNPEKVREAREAIIKGCVALHGVKTYDQLNNITSGLVTL